MSYEEAWNAENPNPPTYSKLDPPTAHSTLKCMVCLGMADCLYDFELKTAREGVGLCVKCARIPKIVIKTWGYENWVVHTDQYCGKLLGVMPERYCSIHSHRLKNETFHLLEGCIRLRHGFDPENLEVGILNPGMSFRIPPGMWHSFEGMSRSVIMEVSTPHLDSDSYRFSPSVSGYPTVYV